MARKDAGDIEVLIGDWEPELSKAFLSSVYRMRSRAKVGQIEDMLTAGNISGALKAVGLDQSSLRPLDKTISDAFESGGNVSSSKIPAPPPGEDGLTAEFVFNVRNPTAEKWLSENAGDLAKDLLDDQRVMIREHMSAGLAAGKNPRDIALDLVGRVGPNGSREGGVLGLTQSQASWVRSYEDELRSENPTSALVRKLRDARFDNTVRKAEENGQPLSDDQIDTMVRSYKNRALKYRADNIARTEAIAALHEAQDQSMGQAVESGLLDPSSITEIWNTSRDRRVRDLHRPMEGQEINYGEVFIDGEGNELRFPGDPKAPAKTRIQCRCWRNFQVDYLAGLK